MTPRKSWSSQDRDRKWRKLWSHHFKTKVAFPISVHIPWYHVLVPLLYSSSSSSSRFIYSGEHLTGFLALTFTAWSLRWSRLVASSPDSSFVYLQINRVYYSVYALIIGVAVVCDFQYRRQFVAILLLLGNFLTAIHNKESPLIHSPFVSVVLLLPTAGKWN